MKKAITLSVLILLSTVWSFAQTADSGDFPQPQCQAGFEVYILESHPPTYLFVPDNFSNVVAYNWDFGNGIISQDSMPSVQFENSGRYIVCLGITYTNGCKAYAFDTLQVAGSNAACQAYWEAFPYHPGDSVGILFSDLPVMALGYHYAFQDMSRGNVVQWNWNFGDGATSTDPNPGHAYEKSGMYTVCLEITTSGNCVSTWCDSLAVGIIPPCSLIGTVVDYTGLDGCGLMIRLDNGEVLEPAEMVPDFSLKPGQRVMLSYTDLFDRASICMAGRIVRIDCISEIPGLCENYIRLTTNMILNSQNCNGSATAMLVDKWGNAAWAKDYLWSTGDVTATVQNLCPGWTYSVSVTDSGGCVVTGSFYFSGGNEYPDSLFGLGNYHQDYTDFVFNLPVFSDSIYCRWDFGDGNTADGSSVNHTYESDIPRTVKLNVYDLKGNLLYNQELVVTPEKSKDIEEPATASPWVFPIPAQDEIFITLGESDGIPERIDVLSTGGQLVLSSQGEKQSDRLYRLNIVSLPAGFYIGKLSYSNGLTHSFRFVK